MGVLAPWYLAGLAALALPVVLHLIRRTPRGQQPFSSLLLLLPSPPRLTRRSRLDQILLLLLRLAALALLATAFARPFWRQAALLTLADLPARRVAILLDTSASMRRGTLWNEARKLVERELEELGPHDEVALLVFHERPETVVGFEARSQTPDADPRQAIRAALRPLEPTWRATDLGAALTSVAAELEAEADRSQQARDLQIVLVSDLQHGARLDALQGFEWPSRVQLVLRPVTLPAETNATVHLVRREEDPPEAASRVRVSNMAGSRGEQFSIVWAAGESPAGSQRPPPGPATSSAGELAAHPLAIQVPPGQSRVFQLPRPRTLPHADRIVLRGDDHPFDNTFYAPPPRPQQVQVVYLGADPPDASAGPLGYLRLALAGDPLRQVTIHQPRPGATGWLSSPPPLVVVTGPLDPGLQDALARYVAQGGVLWAAPADPVAARTLLPLVPGVQLAASAEEPGGYVLLGEIDFGHPLFAPLAQPPYNDFTKIHFWRHRRLVLPERRSERPGTNHLPENESLRVVARFDNGDPALIEARSGRGRLLLWASLWHPEDSQLALSTKFVPLVEALLDLACGTTENLASVLVGQRVELPAGAGYENLRILRPDGREVPLPPGTRHYDDTDQPGIYWVLGGPQPHGFAVNLAPAESAIAPMHKEALEQLGVRLGPALTRAEQLQRVRQQRDSELESRQKMWRWLLVAALAVLGIETWWAGRAARRITQQESLA